ncbi:CvfB family protein [Pectinatus haikarae]|uniref:RNA-binding protein (Virulence factor B family) n=1 Tax=Pectinatus haikarae TaxID=349096 RepID=A0ABT9Y4W6_9FIRM|nr:S1-like domain-containing RNA-binding protein [Pectinatus haikarae]MDQ0202678.1 putative RNA-binding protein (virulence factor B family) [Pectinatus haikarae]
MKNNDTESVNILKPSTVATLKAVRENEMGVFLDAQTGNTSNDILLHKTQQTSLVKVGDMVKVFLYKDPKGRLTASMRVPHMKEGQIARLKVINLSEDGAFLDAGAERGIFLPFAGTRGALKLGDYVWAKLYTDKSGRLAVTMKVEDEMRRASKPAADTVKIGDTIEGSVYNLTDQGAFIFTTERYIAFIQEKEMPEHPHVGANVTARVTYIREDGRLNASLRPIKEKAIYLDAETLLKEIAAHNGKIPYSDKTPPEIIKDRFHISKAAFKRAVGHLLKTSAVVEKDGWIILVDDLKD